MHAHVRLQENKVTGLGLKSFYIYSIHLKLAFIGDSLICFNLYVSKKKNKETNFIFYIRL